MNWDKAEQLLNIVDKARLWPNLKPMHDAAMAELQEAGGTDFLSKALKEAAESKNLHRAEASAHAITKAELEKVTAKRDELIAKVKSYEEAPPSPPDEPVVERRV